MREEKAYPSGFTYKLEFYGLEIKTGYKEYSV